MSVISSAIPVLANGLAILDDVGLCPYTVFVRTVTWSGARVGEIVGGVGPVAADTQLVVGRGKRPMVQLVSDKNVVAPGSPGANQKFKVGPLPPAYPGGGNPIASLFPEGAKNVELFFVVKGPGLPATGLLCKKASEDVSNALYWEVTLESLGKEA